MDFYDSKFHYNANKLPKEATILVYCRNGRRSADALEILKNLRYPRVFNMLGGIEAWKKEGRRTAKGS
jgi:rhodanese-related sulfurtransferase